MGGELKKFISAMLIAGQLNLWPTNYSLAEQIKRFKSSSEQNYNMASTPKTLEKKEEGFFSFPEMKEAANKLLGIKQKDLQKELEKYSKYKLGQLSTYFLFEFYKLSIKERQESDYGKKLYFTISNIYSYREDPQFKAGMSSQIEKPFVTEKTKFEEFIVVLTQNYNSYRSGEEESGKTPIPFVQYLLEGYDQKIPPTLIVPSKIDFIPLIDDKTLNEFIDDSRVSGIDKSATRKDKIEKLTEAFKDFFKTDIESAKEIMKASLYSYYKFEKKEKKQAFADWLLKLSEDERKKLASDILARARIKGPTLPTEIVEEAFKKSKEAKKVEEDELEKLKRELNNYSLSIQSRGIWALTGMLESNPAGEKLEAIERRYEYIKKKKEYFEKLSELKPEEAKKEKAGEEINKCDKEIIALSDWLNKYKLYEYTEKGTIEEQLAALRAGFVYIQSEYLTVNRENLKFVEFLEKLSSENPGLYKLFAKYLLTIDKTCGRFFDGLDPESKRFTKDLKNRIINTFTDENIKAGNERWQDYRSNLPIEELKSEQERVLFQNSAQLDSLQAVLFNKYREAVERNGVGSPEEKKTVALSVATLSALHPLLAAKYFAAITNLAEICKDNPSVYSQALIELAANIRGQAMPVLERVSPIQILPVNVRMVINRLSYAFDEIAKLGPSELSSFTRYDLLNRNLYIEPQAPFLIKQRQPGWKPSLLVPEEYTHLGTYPYFLPPYIYSVPPQTPFTTGGVFNAAQYQPAGGGIILPRFNAFQIYPATELVGAAFKAYLEPTHPHLVPSDYLPGTYISAINPARLLNDINRAFISPLPLEYASLSQAIGGGGGFGVVGKKEKKVVAEKEEEVWNIGAAGLGSIITPTGGTAFGLGYETEGHLFLGGTMIGTRIGRAKEEEGELGIDSAVGGYEELDDGTKKLLYNTIMQAWNPENPSELIITVNREEITVPKEEKPEEKEGKAWMSAREFFVDKNGTIFELKGGVNDFVKMLNYLAGYIDESYKSHSTTAWNIEPKIETIKTKGTGGCALALDIGKSALLTHMQIIPFVTAEEKEVQPFFIQWTGGHARTIEVEKGKKTRVIEVVLPGKMLRLGRERADIEADLAEEQKKLAEAETDEEKDKIKERITALEEEMKKGKAEYIVQDAVFTIRQVEGKKAWELTFGGGAGEVAKKWLEETEAGTAQVATTDWIGRGGFFFKMQAPKISGGGGLYYEGGPVDLETIALLQNAEEARAYIESLHRIGVTLYGSRETAARMVLGGLAHIVPQFTYAKKEETEEKEYEFDTMFFRFIGFLKGLENVGKIDVQRFSNYEQIKQDYEMLMTRVNQDPTQAESLMKEFENKYMNDIKQIFDKYYLGVQIKKNFSLEFSLVAREEENNWAEQKLNTVYGRTLFTWGSGFVRAFTSIPVWGPAGMTGASEMGIAGAGVGFEFLNGFFLQRMALDAGALFAISTEEGKTKFLSVVNEGMKTGYFAQGAVLLFSNILEDSKRYKKLEKEYEIYSKAIEQGKFSRIPEEVRLFIYNEIPEGIIGEKLLKKIKDGDDLPPVAFTEVQMDALTDALYRWFYDEKTRIEKDFDGHWRSYLGASYYHISDKNYWDIATFVELVDKLQAYVIVAGREKEYYEKEQEKVREKKVGIFSGVEFKLKSRKTEWEIGGIVGAVPVEEIGGGLSASVKFNLGNLIPAKVSALAYGTSTHPPYYTSPAYTPYEYTRTPEFGVFVLFTIGSGGPLPTSVQVPPTTGYPWQ